MKKAYITIGVSASGKSTLAKEYLAKHPNLVEVNRDHTRFNVISPGANWSNYNFKHEKEVSEYQEQLIESASQNNHDIIVSDTNINKKYRDQLIKKLDNLGYQIEIINLDLPYKELIKRDNLRENGVGESVIYRQYKDLYQQRNWTYTPNESLRPAIIVDIDGTIAYHNGRGIFEYDKVHMDLPNHFVISMIHSFDSMNYKIIFLTGRPEECRELTIEWLKTHVKVNDYILHMRKDGDFTKDYLIKEKAFMELQTKYNIKGVFEDRPQNIRMWHLLGLKNVITVSDPYIDF